MRNREEILKEYKKTSLNIDDLKSGKISSTNKNNELDNCYKQLSDLSDLYEETLKNTALSRCPFTGSILEMPFDSFGLDGLWWRYVNPIRGDFDPMPSFMAFTGAMKCRYPCESTLFGIDTGPDKPFVYSRLMNKNGMKAVLYSLEVGKHIAYVISYFAIQRPQGISMPNFWATNYYEFVKPNGNHAWYDTCDCDEDHDFNLGKWIKDGSLLWILPNDKSMKLQSGTVGCPYI